MIRKFGLTESEVDYSMDDDQLQSNQADGFAEVRALEVIGGHSAFIGTDCDSI